MVDADSMICDHANTCTQKEGVTSKVEYCSGRHPHRFNHEECQGFHCVHANGAKGAWVKCVRMYRKVVDYD